MKNRFALAVSTFALMTAGAAAAQSGGQPAPEARADAKPPALIVAIAVDQLSSNLFNQYRPQFTGGLRVLSQQGLVYANGYQAHGVTVTCAGHSTILSGAHPATTGIPANDWIDTATGQETYCLAAPDNALAHGRNTDNGPVGPDQMRVSTLGDWIKAVSPQSRVFAVSGKDRGAITLAGRHGDGAYWFTSGWPGDVFGLTTYVEPGQSAEARMAPVAGLNAELAERYAGGGPAWDYAHVQCRALSGDWDMGGWTMAARLPHARIAIENTPLLDELTIETAVRLLREQQLGRRGVTDLLGVSLSGTDRIGHAFGTQGPEMCEQMLRLDAALGVLLTALEDTPGDVWLVLTADHGGSDMPERMRVHGNPEAQRADPDLMRRVNGALRARFDLPADPLRSSGGGLVAVDAERRALPEPLRSQVIAAGVELLNAEPTVALAAARDELLAELLSSEVNPERLDVRQRLRLSAVAGRSPDILRAFQPYHNGTTRQGGAVASHGSPWDYDRRVPIIFWRPGGQGQERFWPIRTIDIAPTLARLAGVPPEGRHDGRCVTIDPAMACPTP